MSESVTAVEAPARGLPPMDHEPGFFQKYGVAIIFLAPTLALLGVWVVYPTIRTIIRSFYDRDGDEFIGIDNYVTVLTDSLFWQDMWNTVLIMVITVAVELVIGFAFAMVMHRVIFARGAIRTSILIPYGIITVVSAFAWQFAFASDSGFVNNLPLISDEMSWFGGRFSSFAVIIMAEVWKTTPFMALLLLAGLTTIDTGLYEAAKVDGASAWKRFTKITLPLVKPAVAALCIFTFLGNWNAYIWPLIVTRSDEMRTLPVGIAFFSSEAASAFHLIMAAAALATIPVLVVFILFQKQIIKGITLTGLKG